MLLETIADYAMKEQTSKLPQAAIHPTLGKETFVP